MIQPVTQIRSSTQIQDATRKSFEGGKAGADALSKSLGAAARTGQTIGIEWMDYLEHFSAQAAATTGKVMKSGSPAKAIEFQSAFAKTSGEQVLARAATFRDLYATLVRDLAKPFVVEPFTGLSGRNVA